MANDLTGQNIQNTYQRVLHVGDDGFMYDGTGSLYTPISASHEITTETSSSHAISADTTSFATNFTASGNISASGNYTGTGHLTVDGNITSTDGNISLKVAKKLYVDGGGDTYISQENNNHIEFFTGNTRRVYINDTKLDVNGDIDSSGTITAVNGFGTIDGGTW